MQQPPHRLSAPAPALSNGWGVAQDYGQAARWYRKAVDQGSAAGIAITLDLFNWAHGQHARYRRGARQRAGGVLSETNSPSTSYKRLRRAI
jgi:TPR repeat protein